MTQSTPLTEDERALLETLGDDGLPVSQLAADDTKMSIARVARAVRGLVLAGRIERHVSVSRGIVLRPTTVAADRPQKER